MRRSIASACFYIGLLNFKPWLGTNLAAGDNRVTGNGPTNLVQAYEPMESTWVKVITCRRVPYVGGSLSPSNINVAWSWRHYYTISSVVGASSKVVGFTFRTIGREDRDSDEGTIVGDHVSKVKCTHTARNSYNVIPTREQGKLRKDHEREVNVEGKTEQRKILVVRLNFEGGFEGVPEHTKKGQGNEFACDYEPGAGVGVQGIIGPLPRKIRERLELNETKSREKLGRTWPTLMVALQCGVGSGTGADEIRNRVCGTIDIPHRHRTSLCWRRVPLQSTADLRSVDPAKKRMHVDVATKPQYAEINNTSRGAPWRSQYGNRNVTFITRSNQHAYAIVDNEHGALPPEERMMESLRTIGSINPGFARRTEGAAEERIYQPRERGGSSHHKQAAERSMFKELTPRAQTAAYCPPQRGCGYGDVFNETTFQEIRAESCQLNWNASAVGAPSSHTKNQDFQNGGYGPD
ncbi:hypothetical protein F5146DRAFT_1000251 [Armillaria mellea]|nr:hypothetical protein F5146DRAFT_1000251 [Armillaria mellea]